MEETVNEKRLELSLVCGFGEAMRKWVLSYHRDNIETLRIKDC